MKTVRDMSDSRISASQDERDRLIRDTMTVLLS